MAQLTPEARARLDAFKDVTVKHAHLTSVDDQLSLWVEEHTDATHVLLCGPGGVGKSKALSVVADTVQRRGARSLRGSHPLAGADPTGSRTLPAAGLLLANHQRAQRASAGQRTAGEGGPPHGRAQSDPLKTGRDRLAQDAGSGGASPDPGARQSRVCG